MTDESFFLTVAGIAMSFAGLMNTFGVLAMPAGTFVYVVVRIER